MVGQIATFGRIYRLIASAYEPCGKLPRLVYGFRFRAAFSSRSVCR